MGEMEGKMPRMSNFRLYRIEGKQMPSVTSILHEYSPEPDALRYWKLSHPDWREIMNYRAKVGTLTHHKIAEHLSEKFKLEKPKPLEMEYTEQMDIEAGAAMSYFDDFIRAHKVIPEQIEMMTWHRYMKYAGTLDFLGMVDGRRVILDWKTSSDIWENHTVQAVAYKQSVLSNRDYKNKIDACGIVMMNPIKGLKVGKVLNEKQRWNDWWNCYDQFQRIWRTTGEIVTMEEAGYND